MDLIKLSVRKAIGLDAVGVKLTWVAFILGEAEDLEWTSKVHHVKVVIEAEQDLSRESLSARERKQTERQQPGRSID